VLIFGHFSKKRAKWTESVIFFTMALRMEEVSIETMEGANSIGY
jgi:hypothetical protein